MEIRVAREHGRRFEEAAQTLLPTEPYLAYANFRPIAAREGALLDLHWKHWQAAVDDAGVLVARDGRDRPLAMLRIGRREFESRHFGKAIARIDSPVAVADEGLRLEALRALYRHSVAALGDSFAHLTAAASSLDRSACWALQEAGAFYVGTRISWMQPLTGERRERALPDGLRIEHYERPDLERLPRASWKRLFEWASEAFDRGPFVFDLNVPIDQARRIYQVWTEKALTGEWADIVIVVRDGEEVVSFHTMKLLPELSEAAGVGIVGQGIGGTLPGYRSLFTALQRECAATRPLGAHYLENETQASTIASIQVFGKLGHQCVRSTHGFHLSLEAAPRRR